MHLCWLHALKWMTEWRIKGITSGTKLLPATHTHTCARTHMHTHTVYGMCIYIYIHSLCPQPGFGRSKSRLQCGSSLRLNISFGKKATPQRGAPGLTPTLRTTQAEVPSVSSPGPFHSAPDNAIPTAGLSGLITRKLHRNPCLRLSLLPSMWATFTLRCTGNPWRGLDLPLA